MSLYQTRTDSRAFQGMKQLADWLIDLIFPHKCPGCGRVDSRWCGRCLDDLQGIPAIYTLHSDLDDVGATGLYQDKLKKAIHAFKYNGATELAAPLAERLAKALEQQKRGFELIIPVPLFEKRREERGYNQAELLAWHVAQCMEITWAPGCLRRIRDTSQQVGLDPQQRKENVRDAFEATSDVHNRTVLLIDDVVTTGATSEACAAALKKAGAATVYTMAVAMPKNNISTQTGA